MPVFEPFEDAFTALAQAFGSGLGQDGAGGLPVEEGLDPGKALVRSWTKPPEGADTTKAFGKDVFTGRGVCDKGIGVSVRPCGDVPGIVKLVK